MTHDEIKQPRAAPRTECSPLADFIRNATPEEKERIYTIAMERVSQQQREMIERVTLLRDHKSDG